MTNEEHHQYISGILLKLDDVLDCAELDALARCTGIRIDEFYPGDCKRFAYLSAPKIEENTAPF